MTHANEDRADTRRGRRWAVAVLAGLVLLAGCTDTTAPVPSASGTPERFPSASIAPSDPPAATARAEPAEFLLPAPTCPSPPGPVIVPDVLVSIGDAPGVIATRGATVFSTCTTTNATDVVGDRPMASLSARPDDRFLLRIQDGWRILRVEGYDTPAVGEGGNVNAPIDTPEGTNRVEVPVPRRDGDARAGWTLWLVRADGRAVGQLEVSILVQITTGG